MSGSTGETPNWAAGYVPSASEWNSWWGRKVDMSNALFTGAPFLSLSGGFMTGPLYLSDDPVASSQAVNKAYADSKLSSSGGGVINGSLGVTDSLNVKDVYVQDALLINKYNSYEWYMTVASTGDHVQFYRPGWFDAWISAGGSRHWVGANVDLMVLDGGGNLNVTNTVTAATITSNGNIFANQLVAANGVFGKALGLNGWVFYNDGTYYVQEFTPGWQDRWQISNGDRAWVNGNVEVMRITGAGNMTLLGAFNAGYMNCTGQVDAAGAVTALGGQMNMSSSGTTRNLQMSPNWYWSWETANGTLSWVGPLPTQKVFVQARSTDLVWVNYLGPVAGTGAYIDSSDERRKTGIVPASCGLADVLKLNPIEFNRIDQDGPREIGFSAQNVRDVMPLAVRPFDDLDSDDPMLAVTTDSIIAALVNGMKELAAEVAALKAVR